MKKLCLLLAVVLFINCNKNELGACLEESSIKETSIYGTWLLKRSSGSDDVSGDTKIRCYENTGSIVTFTASNTFSWDRLNGDIALEACFQDTFSGTFELSKKAEGNYIGLFRKCDDDKLWALNLQYSFENQYLLTSGSCEGKCYFWYVRLR